MGNEAIKKMDPEPLSRMNVADVKSLSEIFCSSLRGKVALVTGGASGLRYTVVNRLCEAGAKVVIASRGEERGQRAVADFKEKGYEVSWVKTDVRSVDDCYEAVDYTVRIYGQLDVLVANAAGWDRSYSPWAAACMSLQHCLKFTGTAANNNVAFLGNSIPVGMILIYVATAIGGFASVLSQFTFAAFCQSNTPKEDIPAAQALYTIGATGGSAIFGAIVGVVLGSSGDFTRAFLLGIVFGVVGLICAVFGFKFTLEEIAAEDARIAGGTAE